jgi:hypothetical protein
MPEILIRVLSISLRRTEKRQNDQNGSSPAYLSNVEQNKGMIND